MSKGTSIILIIVALLAVIFIASTFTSNVDTAELSTDSSLSVTQTQEGNLPEYGIRETDENVTGYEVIQTEEGQIPEYVIEDNQPQNSGMLPVDEPVEVAPQY